MTTIVSGRVVETETGAALDDMRVIALGDWLLTTEKLGEAKTENGGQFRLEIDGVNGTPLVPSSFRVRVVDVVGRPLTADIDVPGTVATHEMGDVKVAAADKDGLQVTNLTGTAQFVSDGNAVRLLVDGAEAFGRIAEDMQGAKQSVNMVQLFFALPEYDTFPAKEDPALVFKFLPPDLVPIEPNDPSHPDPPDRNDLRPERLLIDVAHADGTIRILLNEPALGWPEGVFWLAVLTPLALGLGLGGVAGIAALAGVGIAFFPILLAATLIAYFVEAVLISSTLEDTSDVEKVTAYFEEAIEDGSAGADITVRGLRQGLPQNGVLHCKMVITDEQRAVVVGSPFSQRYFDAFNHRIDDPHRGSNTSDMVHDLSISVVGPAVHDLFETFRLYWNEAVVENEEIDEPAAVPPEVTDGDDLVSKVQVVRTLSGRRFDKELHGKNEKGILESYLRAFATAEKYIYLETQYFTDSVITDALCAALKAKSSLELILVVPIKPDVIFYPRRQAKRIDQLRAAGGDRVGVFTRWTYNHNVPAGARPWVAPVYIHAKGGIVDDSWAIVGSANLDGLSLDHNLLLSPLSFGETMAAELNISVIPPTPGQPAPFAELMRRRLFAEHLGLVGVDGKPDPGHGGLDQPPAGGGWLGLWRPMAAEALRHVTEARHEPLNGFVLEYPKEDGGWLDRPRKHLNALGVNVKLPGGLIRAVTGTRGFNFGTGEWNATPELEDIK